MNRLATIAFALALAPIAFDACAQHVGHSSTPTQPPGKAHSTVTGHAGQHTTGGASRTSPPTGTAELAADHDMSTMQRDAPDPGHPVSMPHDMQGMNHDASTMQHEGMHHDMSSMSHDMQGMDHDTPAIQHDMSTMSTGRPAPDAAPRTPVPEPTDADRAAAFPPLGGHPAHDRGRFGFLRVDRLERTDADGLGWEATGWYGGDVHRAWLRTEGHAVDGRVDDASVELLYGRLVTPWWDAVAGVRQDFGRGPSRSWASFGVQGLAPYKFDVHATGYLGGGGRTAARVEAGYDTLLTNRWVLQWRAEANLYGRDDAARGIGRGLSTVEAGARLRYEITRGFAPYVGIESERAYGHTATLRRSGGDGARDTRVVAGVRLAF